MIRVVPHWTAAFADGTTSSATGYGSALAGDLPGSDSSPLSSDVQETTASSSQPASLPEKARPADSKVLEGVGDLRVGGASFLRQGTRRVVLQQDVDHLLIRQKGRKKETPVPGNRAPLFRVHADNLQHERGPCVPKDGGHCRKNCLTTS